MTLKTFNRLFTHEPTGHDIGGVVIRGQRWYIRGEAEMLEMLRLAGMNGSKGPSCAGNDISLDRHA